MPRDTTNTGLNWHKPHVADFVSTLTLLPQRDDKNPTAITQKRILGRHMAQSSLPERPAKVPYSAYVLSVTRFPIRPLTSVIPAHFTVKSHQRSRLEERQLVTPYPYQRH